ncbi:polyphosphate polymerase domain-containing protein [Streptococcus suis]|nr:polyphosphate polymerase domain-containing protein [Streptococcus suis]
MKTRIIQKQFKRKETKYILDKETLECLEKDLQTYMRLDEFATSTITNIYFDSEQFEMIQDALAKKNGREKIRMRIYDSQPSEHSQAFLEIKKKENKIGYKYRLTSNPLSIVNYIENGIADATIRDQAVISELEGLKQRYGNIRQKMYIYYDRVSYKGLEDKKLRLTIDKNLIYRNHNVDAVAGKFGEVLLDPNKVIMEIKVPHQRPEWLKALLEKYQIEKQSFSKYGNAYKLSYGIDEEVHHHAVV